MASVSNVSIQYNYTSASIATAVMLSHRDVTGANVIPDFPEPLWAQHYLLSMVFVGSVAGMIAMGYLGDRMGIHRALVLTNALTVTGALVSALLSWGPPEAVWGVILVGRFLLGAGVGGSYPLSAAKAAEKSTVAKEAVEKAAHAFFWQGPGSALPYLVAMAVLELPPTENVTSIQFRILLGLGAVPALVVWAATIMDTDPIPAKRSQGGHFREAIRRPRHWRNLVGCAGSWFLFDVAFYGTVIFAPSILSDVFGAKQSLLDLSRRACLMIAVGILGTFLGIQALPYIGAKTLNTVGLLCGALLYGTFAAVKVWLPGHPLLLLTLLALLYLSLYCGPNIATYVLPVFSFPPHLRSTFHGLSSAAAKVGAMLGALLFPLINHAYGVPTVMAVQAVVCALGALLSHLCLDGEVHDEDSSSSSDLEEIERDALRARFSDCAACRTLSGSSLEEEESLEPSRS